MLSQSTVSLRPRKEPSNMLGRKLEIKGIGYSSEWANPHVDNKDI